MQQKTSDFKIFKYNLKALKSFKVLTLKCNPIISKGQSKKKKKKKELSIVMSA